MRKIANLFTVLIVFLCVNAGVVNAQEKIAWDKITKQFQRNLKLVLNNYEKIWHEGYPNLEVQFSNGERAWKITKDSLVEYKKGNFPKFNDSEFNFMDVSVNNRPILQFVMSDNFLRSRVANRSRSTDIEILALKMLSDIVFHEAFHFYVQGKLHLKVNNTSGSVSQETPADAGLIKSETIKASRDTTYPIDVTPRIYRNNIFKTLIKAYVYRSQRSQYLSDARYWQDKYHKEFTKEAKSIRTYDITEGNARYVDGLALIYTEVGFDAEPKTFQAKALVELNKVETLTAVDYESYAIGLVSGLLLDESDKNWKKENYGKTQKVITPLEILLKNVQPSSAQPKVSFRHTSELKALQAEQNVRLKKTMDEVKKIYNGSKKYKLLILPLSRYSFGMEAGYSNTELNTENTVFVGYKQTIELKDGTIKINYATVFNFPSRQNKCGYFSVGTLALNEVNKVSINAPVTEKRNAKGQTIICVTAPKLPFNIPMIQN